MWSCINGIIADDLDICIGDLEPYPWFQIDFGESVIIDGFIVHNYKLRGCNSLLMCSPLFDAHVAPSDFGDECEPCDCDDPGNTCGAVLRVGDFSCFEGQVIPCTNNTICNVFTSDADEVTVQCSPSPLNGRYAQLILTGDSRLLVLRELQAYGSWNPIFLNMTNASLPILRRDPDNCINMIDDDDSDFCYGTATGKAATWFQIDFGNAVTILAFVVYNRMDLDCNYRLQCGSTCDPCECTDADAGVCYQ